jgi:hypothetical protein
MKLDANTISYLNDVVKTAQLIGCDEIMIEPERVRGIDEARTVCILQTESVPDMPFGSIGLNRLSVFQSRYEIAKVQDNFSIEAEEAVAKIEQDDGTKVDMPIARALTMKGKGTKIQYRCSNPGVMRAPKVIKDELKARVQLSGDAVLLLQKGQAAMGADTVTIISNDGVSFEFTDVNNDVFKHTFAEDADDLLGDGDTKFAHRYPAKTLLALFKHNPTGTFSVGNAGTLWLEINGLNVIVLPQV